MPDKTTGVVFGCIVPHPPLLVPDIGRGQEAAICATTEAMRKLAGELAQARPDALAIISPHGNGHGEAMGVFTGTSTSGDLKGWGDRTPRRAFLNDQHLASAILDECAAAHIAAQPLGEDGYELDHGVMVPMHFLAPRVENTPLLPLTFSYLPLETHFYFGKAIASAASRLGRRLAIIASGDLSHRLIPGAPAGYEPGGKVFDRQLVDAVAKMDSNAVLNLDPAFIERAGECGLRSITILLGAIEGLQAHPQVLSYEGPFGVGYLVASFTVGSAAQPADARPAAREVHPLVELARQAVESRIRGAPLRKPANLTPEMKERAGVFVCLKKQGELRGCIGTFEPTRANVAEEVVSNAISSATRDPRFPPVSPSELPEMEYSVDVLTSPEPVKGQEELDPKRYGVIVESGGRRGLLLPDLEGVDSVEDQIAISRQKAGIGPDEPVALYRFEVRRYK